MNTLYDEVKSEIDPTYKTSDPGKMKLGADLNPRPPKRDMISNCEEEITMCQELVQIVTLVANRLSITHTVLIVDDAVRR